MESVLKQDFKDFELIVINDGSIDDTREVIKSFNDKRIVYVENEKNCGINVARNKGYSKAKGSYVALIDDDDELASFALQLAFDTLNKINQKILFFNSFDVEAKKISGKVLSKPIIIKYVDLLSQKLKGDYWVVFEKTLFQGEKIFDDAVGGCGNTWLRLLKNNDGFYNPAVVYFAYRKHNFQRITNYRSWRERESNAQKLFSEFGDDMKLFCPKMYAKQAAILAFYQLMNKKKLQARSNILLSLKNRFSVYAVALLPFTYVGNNILPTIYRISKKYLDRIHF